MKYIVLILFPFISFSCKKDTATYDVVFKKDTAIVNNCGCDARFIKNLTDYETNVVFATDTSFWKQDIIDAIVYNNDSALFTMVKKHGEMIGRGKICNSQDIILYFDIHSDKEYKVKISGKEYASCDSWYAPAIYTYSDILITELKLLK